jgi:hypothetical protein
VKQKITQSKFLKGFAIGSVVGLICWAYYHDFIPFVPIIPFVKYLIFVSSAICFAVVLFMNFINAFQKKAVFSTYVDGCLVGYVALFELLHVFLQLLAGKFPFSIDSIVWMNL